MLSKAAISYSYAVLTFQIDDAGAVAVPIGVALWSPERQWAKFRMVEEGERLRQFNSRENYPLVRFVRQKLEKWLSTNKLPYSEGPMTPYVDDWWRHVRDLLIHQVRLSEPRSIDCRNPDEELEPLYEAIVSSHRSREEQRARVDGEIRKCLNGLSDTFKSRQPLLGFGGRQVEVLRSYHGSQGWVVIEGVNLATQEAEAKADATVSRLLRVREGLREPAEIIVGYLASPEGLNGEKVLVDWIEHKTQARVLDLVKQRTIFHDTAENLVAKAGGVKELF
jgi:hypothetical protein